MADPRVSATGSISGIPDDATWVERAWWAFGTPEPRPVHYIASANLVVRRTAFDAIGGFDETLVTDEDADIGTRLSGAGHRMIDDPAVRVVHLDNAKTLAQFAAKERWHATSIVRGTSLRDLDKPMWMTWMFIGCALLFLASWFLAVRSPWWPAAGFSLLLVPPALTAAFRGLQYRKWRFFFSWIVLYFVFYAVRSVRVLHVLFRSNAG